MLKCNLRIIMATKRINDLSDVMAMTGISRNTLNKLYREENLDTVRLENLMKVCDALGCPLSELVEYIPEDADKKNKDIP